MSDDIDLFFPIEWNFGENPSDGLGGKPVDSGGTIYVYRDDDGDVDLLKITSLQQLVDDVLDGSGALVKGAVPEMHIKSVSAIRDAFLDAAKQLSDVLPEQ
jgi:hypothetical protein